MKTILIIIIVILVSAGCNKHPIPKPATSTLEIFAYKKLDQVAAIRLFTKMGEITNPDLVNKYTTRYADYFYDANAILSGNRFKSYSWVNGDSVIDTGIVPVGEMKRVQQDTYDVFFSPILMPLNDTSNVALHIVKYKFFDSMQLNSTQKFYVKHDPGAVLKRTNTSMTVPLMRYIITSNHDGIFNFSADLMNNVFDPAGLNRLEEHDTLLLQSLQVILEKSN